MGVYTAPEEGFFIVRLTVLLLLAVIAVPTPLPAAKKGEVEFRAIDAKTGEPIAVRMHLKNAKGKSVKPPNSIFWHDHFLVDGAITLELPKGTYTFEMERGPEYKIRTGQFSIEDNASDSKELSMERFVDMAAEGWYAGDLDVERSADDIETLMKAEDLYFAPVVRPRKSAALMLDSTPVRFDAKRFYQLGAQRDGRAGSGLLLYGVAEPLDVNATAEHPSSVFLLRQAMETKRARAAAERANCWDLPAWIATGQLDAILVAHREVQRSGAPARELPGKPGDRIRFAPPRGVGRWSQEIYYQLLNCGLRIPPAAGSGSGVSPNPVGYNRIYVHCDGQPGWNDWWQGLKAGRVMVTNGPIMTPKVNGQSPGHVFRADEGETVELSVTLNLYTREKIDYFEVVQNGKVVHEVRLDKWAQSNGMLPPVRFGESGWILVRGVTTNQDTYRYATSGPFYVEIGQQPRISKAAAQFFYDWTFERARQIKLDDPAQQEEVMAFHRAARDFWKSLLDRANAE